jgi:hypothetical protein
MLHWLRSRRLSMELKKLLAINITMKKRQKFKSSYSIILLLYNTYTILLSSDLVSSTSVLFSNVVDICNSNPDFSEDMFHLKYLININLMIPRKKLLNETEFGGGSNAIIFAKLKLQEEKKIIHQTRK